MGESVGEACKLAPVHRALKIENSRNAAHETRRSPRKERFDFSHEGVDLRLDRQVMRVEIVERHRHGSSTVSKKSGYPR